MVSDFGKPLYENWLSLLFLLLLLSCIRLPSQLKLNRLKNQKKCIQQSKRSLERQALKCKMPIVPFVQKSRIGRTSSSHTVTPPTRHWSIHKDRQFTSRPDDASWIRRKTLPLNPTRWIHCRSVTSESTVAMYLAHAQLWSAPQSKWSQYKVNWLLTGVKTACDPVTRMWRILCDGE